jgi:hypothetical protein
LGEFSPSISCVVLAAANVDVDVAELARAVSDRLTDVFFFFFDDLSSLVLLLPVLLNNAEIELSVRNRQASLTRSVLASTILSDCSQAVLSQATIIVCNNCTPFSTEAHS